MPDSMRPYFWRMPVDILVWMYRHFALQLPLFNWSLSRMNSLLWLQLSVCSKEDEEDYEHLTSIMLNYRLGVPYHDVASSVEVFQVMEGKQWSETDHWCVIHLPAFVGAELICTHFRAFKHWSNRQIHCSILLYRNLIFCHYIFRFKFLLHLNFFSP